MQTQMERRFPILMDVGVQGEMYPSRDYVFMYDDGTAYRAFLCDDIDLDKWGSVSAIWKKGDERGVIASIPSTTPWRFVHRSVIEFVRGREMEEVELKNFQAKKELHEKLMKELKLDSKDEDKIDTEYSRSGYNEKLYR